MKKITVLIASLMLGNVSVSWGMSQEAREVVTIVKEHFEIPETTPVDYEAIKNFDFETPLRTNVSDEVYKQRLVLLGAMIGRNIPKDDYVQNLQFFYDSWPAMRATGWAQFADFTPLAGMFVEYPGPEIIASSTETSVGTVITRKQEPRRWFLHVTEPIAQGMLIRLNRIEKRKKTDEDFIVQLPHYLRHLNNSEKQARFLANYFINTTLTRAINNVRYSKPAFRLLRKSLDEAIETCYREIPFFDSFTVVSKQYFQDRNPVSYKEFSGVIRFSQVLEQTFEKLQSYGSNVASLVDAYRVLHRRILTKIVNPDTQVVGPIAPQPALVEQVQEVPINVVEPIIHPVVIPQKAYVPLTYHKRVTRWFSEKFVSNKKLSSIIYHTLLPQLADPIVVADGICVEWNNKTTGQKDNLYRMPGKMINDNGDEKFYIFESCIAPDGICYHRGCKVTQFDDIDKELDATLKIPYELENDTQGYEYVDESKSSILEDNDEYAVVSNPDRHCKIWLFKLS